MREFANASVGYSERSNEEWQRTRLISYYSYFPHVKNGPKSPQELFPLPGDKEQKKSRHQNKQEVYKTLEKWSK